MAAQLKKKKKQGSATFKHTLGKSPITLHRVDQTQTQTQWTRGFNRCRLMRLHEEQLKLNEANEEGRQSGVEGTQRWRLTMKSDGK